MLNNFLGIQYYYSNHGYQIPDPESSPSEQLKGAEALSSAVEQDTLFPDSQLVREEDGKSKSVFVSPKKMNRAPSVSEKYVTCSYPSQSGIDSISSSLQRDLDAMLDLSISMPSPDGESGCLFTTGRGKKMVISEEKMKEAESKLSGYAKEESESVAKTEPEPCLFSTGRGKKMVISEEKLKEAEKKLSGYAKEEEGEALPTSETESCLFSTGRGKKITVSEEKLKAAKKKLNGYAKEENSKTESEPCLFSTGRGKKISISEEKLKEAEKKLNGYAKGEDSETSLFSTGRGKRIVISEDKMKAAREKLNGYAKREDGEAPPASEAEPWLFSTGRGKKITISEERMKAAEKKLNGYAKGEDDTPSNPDPQPFLFSTGRGKKISISEEKLMEAESKLNGYAKGEDTPPNPNPEPCLFSTGRGKKISISEDKLKEAASKLNNYANETEDTETSLFSTGRGKKIAINEEKLKEAESKLTTSLFTTGKGKEVSISPQQLNQAEALLSTLAAQEEVAITSEHPARASPDRLPEQSLVEKVGSQRVSVAAGSGPRKPHLAPPSPKKEKEKNLHSVDREKYEKNIQSKRRKRKEYVPIRIMNDNLIYSQPDARKSSARRKGGAGVKQKAVSEEVARMMEKWGYTPSITDCATPENGAFPSIAKTCLSPYRQEYAELKEMIRTTVEAGGMKLKPQDALEATDLFYAIAQCEYAVQSEFDERLEKAGVSALVRSITSRNAEFVVFASDAMEAFPSSFHSDEESMNPMFERLLRLMEKEGAEAPLITLPWIRCQYRNILWKQASKTKWTRSMEHVRLRSVLQQLMWRYFTELYFARPPPLKRVVQRDESEARFLTCIMSDVLFVPPLPDYDVIEEAKEKKEPLAGVIELTDGWYFIEAMLDPSLTALLQVHQIHTGMKLRIACAKIQNNNNGCAPLEMRVNQPRKVAVQSDESSPPTLSFFNEEGCATPRYMLQYNNTRRAAWQSYVGFTNCYTFNTNVNDCINEGGTIPQTDVVVVRKYGVRFQEQVGEKRVYRTEEEERQEQRRWEEAYSGITKEVVSRLMKAWEEEEQRVGEEELEAYRSRREPERQREIEEEVHRVMEKKGLKERVVSMIGYLQVMSPYRFEGVGVGCGGGVGSSCKREGSENALQKEVSKNALQKEVENKNALQKETESKNSETIDINALCSVAGLDVNPVVGASHHLYDTISITLWNTNAGVMDMLKEGCVYRVTMLQAQQSVERQRNELLLSTSNSTRWEEITEEYKERMRGKRSVFDVWKPRRVVCLKEMEKGWREAGCVNRDCDVFLFFLFSSEKKPSGCYEVTFCDVSGTVAILTVPELFYVGLRVWREL